MLLGRSLRDVALLLAQALILVVLAIPFGLEINLGGVAVAFAMLALIGLMMSPVSYTLALVLKSEDSLAPVVNGVALPLLLLSGVMLPMSLAPDWLQTVAKFNPLYHAVAAIRALFNANYGDGKSSSAWSCCRLAALTIWRRGPRLQPRRRLTRPARPAPAGAGASRSPLSRGATVWLRLFGAPRGRGATMPHGDRGARRRRDHGGSNGRRPSGRTSDGGLRPNRLPGRTGATRARARPPARRPGRPRTERPLHIREWSSAGEPWARVLIVHGIGEHSGRYERTGRLLAEAGLDVDAFDLRGHGLSGGRRVYVREWDDFLDDVEVRLAALRRPGLPLVLFGHSMGALIALNYAC